MNYKRGDRIAWSYTHAVGRNRFRRVKHGILMRVSLDGKAAIVNFDGNISLSRVPIDEVRQLPTNQKDAQQ